MPKELRARAPRALRRLARAHDGDSASSGTRSSATTSSRRPCSGASSDRRAPTSSARSARGQAPGRRRGRRWTCRLPRSRAPPGARRRPPPGRRSAAARGAARSRACTHAGAASSSERRTILRSAIDEARRVGNDAVEAHARLDLNALRTRVDPDVEASRTSSSEALEIAAALEPTGDLPNLARAYREIGMARFMLGRAGEGEADLERAAEFARQAGDSALERTALVARLRPVAWGPTPADVGIAFCDAPSRAARPRTSRTRRSRSTFVRCCSPCAATSAGVRTSSARTHGRSSRSSVSRWAGASTRWTSASHLLLAGDLEQAEHELRRGHDLLAAVGDTGAQVHGRRDARRRSPYARVASTRRLRFAEESRAIAAPDDLDAQPRWRAALARVLASQGLHDAALELAREAVALVEPIDLLPLKAVVYDVARRGARDARAGSTRPPPPSSRRSALHEQKGNVVSAARSRAVLDELRARDPRRLIPWRRARTAGSRTRPRRASACRARRRSRRSRRASSARSSPSSSATSSARPRSASRPIRRRSARGCAATSRISARSSSATAAPSRSSSATRSWPSSGSPSRTRTTRCARCARPSEMRAAIAAHGLEARIGINTGEVVVGGEGETLVTGDAVNVAARLEQAAARRRDAHRRRDATASSATPSASSRSSRSR